MSANLSACNQVLTGLAARGAQAAARRAGPAHANPRSLGMRLHDERAGRRLARASGEASPYAATALRRG